MDSQKTGHTSALAASPDHLSKPLSFRSMSSCLQPPLSQGARGRGKETAHILPGSSLVVSLFPSVTQHAPGHAYNLLSEVYQKKMHFSCELMRAVRAHQTSAPYIQKVMQMETP